MNLAKEIKAAEDLLGPKLESYFISVFGDTFLTSHGLEHHKRVWKNARAIISHIEICKSVTDRDLPLKLIIASYLHDSGMAADHGPKHGKLGRQHCETFLRDNGFTVNNFTDLLDAVENHDNKDYPPSYGYSQLLSLLSAADDIDALGYTGIYRYLEIYLVRKIPYLDIGNEILKNSSRRWTHITRIIHRIPEMVDEQSKRYDILKSFFRSYNDQIQNYCFGSNMISGFCGVVELIGNAVESRISLSVMLPPSELKRYDQVIQTFFSRLRDEPESST